jgi:hypothetical protein
MFQLYSNHQAYLQSLVQLYMLNVYAVWDPSSEVKDMHTELKSMNHSVDYKQINRRCIELRNVIT